MANTLPFKCGAIVKVTTIRGREYKGKLACVIGDFLILKEEYIFENEEGSRTGQKEHHVKISEIESSKYIFRNELRPMQKTLTEEERKAYGISDELTVYNAAGLCFGDGRMIPAAKSCANKE